MTASTDLAPGYRMTDIGPMPEEWEVAHIGDLFDMRQGKSLSPRSRLGLSPVRFLRTANVLWGRVDLTKVDQMDFSDREVEVYSLRPQDLLVCEGGDVGRTALWTGALDPCCYQNHLHRLRAKRDDVWPLFYAFWMQAALTLLGLYVGAENRSTIPNLSQARLRVFAVPKPPLSEQRKIAAVLDTVRRALEATDRVIAAAQELKRSLMQYLFTYGPVPHDQADQVVLKETKVGTLPEVWHEDKLSHLCGRRGGSIQTGPFGSQLHASDYVRDGVPSVMPRDIGPSQIITTSIARVGQDVYNRLARHSLLVGDIVLARRGEIGRRALVRPEHEGWLCGTGCLRIRLGESEVRPDFLYHYLGSPAVVSWLVAQAIGTTMLNLSSTMLRDVPVLFPSPSEQLAIADFLEATDRKLRKEQDCRSALESLFSTMLRLLMTGQVRVHSLDLSPEEKN